MTLATIRQRHRDVLSSRRAYPAGLAAEQSEARALGGVVELKPRADNRWTEGEWQAIRDLYPDYAAIRKVLAHRSWKAIKSQMRNLGIATAKHKAQMWTAAEVAKLRKLYPKVSLDELKAAFPNRTLRQIHTQGSSQRLSRPKRQLMSTGIPLLDSIRERACALNYSLGDLDRLACTGNYFAANEHNKPSKGQRSNRGYVKMALAVKALGGTLTVDWGSEE